MKGILISRGKGDHARWTGPKGSDDTQCMDHMLAGIKH